MSRIITWALIVFALFYLVTDPSGAAHFVTSAFGGLKSVGHSLSSFVSSL